MKTLSVKSPLVLKLGVFKVFSFEVFKQNISVYFMTLNNPGTNRFNWLLHIPYIQLSTTNGQPCLLSLQFCTHTPHQLSLEIRHLIKVYLNWNNTCYFFLQDRIDFRLTVYLLPKKSCCMLRVSLFIHFNDFHSFV